MKDVDVPILIQGLNKAGLTLEEIEKQTGINRSFITNIKNALMPAPEAWQCAFRLIDLHFRYNPKKYIPLYGNHNEP